LLPFGLRIHQTISDLIEQLAEIFMVFGIKLKIIQMALQQQLTFAQSVTP
jgi:hypothetical protein